MISAFTTRSLLTTSIQTSFAADTPSTRAPPLDKVRASMLKPSAFVSRSRIFTSSPEVAAKRAASTSKRVEVPAKSWAPMVPAAALKTTSPPLASTAATPSPLLSMMSPPTDSMLTRFPAPAVALPTWFPSAAPSPIVMSPVALRATSEATPDVPPTMSASIWSSPAKTSKQTSVAEVTPATVPPPFAKLSSAIVRLPPRPST